MTSKKEEINVKEALIRWMYLIKRQKEKEKITLLKNVMTGMQVKEKVLNAWKEVIRARIIKKGDIKH